MRQRCPSAACLSAPLEEEPIAGEIGVNPREMPWHSDQRRPGIARKLLRGSRDAEYTTLLRLDAGVRFPSHSHPAGEELFVVDGRIRIETERFPARLDAVAFRNEQTFLNYYY